MNKSKGGFTLIELLVVVSIVSLISSLIVSAMRTSREKARDARRKADLHQLRLALQLYSTDNKGYYPSETWCDSSLGTSGVAACPPDPAGDDWNYGSVFVISLVGGNYISVMPKDPINNSTYYYDYEPDCNQGVCPVGCCYYVLTARLEGGGTYRVKSY